MYSFEGDFCRRPIQNLSGISAVSKDRDSLIKNAQVERQKREQARKELKNAIIIQSMSRSYLSRKKLNLKLSNEFENYFKTKGLKTFLDLDYLLKRLLQFYDADTDGERVIQICQFVIKNSQEMFSKILATSTEAENKIWLYRTQKLLIICIRQIFLPKHSLAIPLRMLEIFTSFKDIQKLLSQQKEDEITKYLMNLFSYLIDKNYFKYLRQMIDDKIPDFTYDSDTTNSFTQLSKALQEMLERPLHLITSSEFIKREYETKVLQSFTNNFLSKPYNSTIEFFIIPSLAANKQFPYANLINYLSITYQEEQNYRNSLLIDLSDGGGGGIRKKSDVGKVDFNSYLLYAVLRLDKLFLDQLNDINFLESYLNVIATMIHNISKLPKATTNHQYIFKQFDDVQEEDSSDSESEDEDSPMHPAQETGILKKIIEYLNESCRVTKIASNIDGLLNRPDLIISLCKCCHNLLTINRLAINEYSLLYTLAFKPNFIRTLWYTLLTSHTIDKNQLSISLLSKGIQIPKYDSDQVVPVLATFCALFGRLLTTLHDGEFFFCYMDTEEDKLLTQSSVEPIKNSLMPFKIKEIELLATTLKDISMGLVELAFPETRQNLKHHYSNILTGEEEAGSSSQANQFIQDKNVWSHLLKACVSLMRQLYTRDLRCNFCPQDHWIAQNLNLPLDKPSDLNITRRRGPRPFQPIRDFTRKDLEENGPPLSTKQVRSITILREIPFVVSFNTRVSVFQGLLAADKLRTQGDLQGFLQGPQIHIVLRRTHLYEDAYDKLSPENEPDLKSKFRVQLINSVGLEEAGVDGGGIFREFLSELIKAAFDPHRGLFLITKDNMLYPNPSVSKILENYMRHYYFIGRILGKALYENLLVELPLAEFFLSKLAGRNSDILDIHQLTSLDPVLHRNLMSLKAYEGDVADLGLDFTVVCDELGETRVEELKSNGSNIMVTSENKLEYIQLMADFKLNKQIRNQCLAFRQGLANVLPIEWLYMFSNKELQVLISGAEIPVDVDDLRKHTRYSGDYSAEHKTIKLFWKAVHNFTDIQRRQLLRFVTSCSRPPLLGFKDLDPPFCIQNAGDTDRLPSASTCMNLLKLPAFSKEETLSEKLLYAIQSGVGFELS